MPRELKKPEPTAVMYLRVKSKNKRFIASLARKKGVTVTAYIDYLIDCHRDKIAGKQKKSS